MARLGFTGRKPALVHAAARVRVPRIAALDVLRVSVSSAEKDSRAAPNERLFDFYAKHRAGTVEIATSEANAETPRTPSRAERKLRRFAAWNKEPAD